MQVKNARNYATWYASYMQDDQGKALVQCLRDKVAQQDVLLSAILGELELAQSPKELDAETVLNSVRDMINQTDEVSVKIGGFKWTC